MTSPGPEVPGWLSNDYHTYLSAYCYHGLHAPEPGYSSPEAMGLSSGGGTCRLTCKHCGAKCVCECHEGA